MYSPRHARPSCLPLRAAVTTSLTAVLLPIALAAPALAAEPSASPAGTTSPEGSTSSAPVEDERATTTMRISADPIAADGHSRIGVRLLADGQYVPRETVVVQKATDAGWVEIGRLTTDGNGLGVGRLPFSGDTRVRATSAGNLDRTSGVSPEAVVRKRLATTMRISAGTTASDGKARIGVRVLDSTGAPVVGEYVAIEAKRTDGTWGYIGRAMTDGGGHALAHLPFDRDTRIRSGYSGNARTLGARSPEAVVNYATLGERAVQIASQQAGKPYRYGATGPSSFDCSGFTTYIYKTRLGKSIPRTSAQQEAAIPRVAQSAKRPGDLLFFRTGGRVSHVGVYAGSGKMWAAPTSGDRVKLQAIYTSSYTVGRVG